MGIFCKFAAKSILMKLIEIEDLSFPGVDVYSGLTEASLRGYDTSGIFIAESPKVICSALQHGYEPVSLLCERKHIDGDAAEIIAGQPGLTVYTGSRELLSKLTGYKLTRGVLCAMRRKPLPSVDSITGQSKIIAILQSITDTTNIGAIFRSASALGVDGIIVSADTCDPLNRRAVRVSMGTVFSVPWTIADNPVKEVSSRGFQTAALALNDNSISLDDNSLKEIDRLAVVFGTEGDGLPRKVIASCDHVVRIPMHHGVDSLNVAAAAAVTFWELRNRH